MVLLTPVAAISQISTNQLSESFYKVRFTPFHNCDPKYQTHTESAFALYVPWRTLA